MLPAISHKNIGFQHFRIHHLSFKNVNPDDLVELFDAINEQLYQSKAAIVNCLLTGNRSSAKTIKKAIKKVFDEVNWPLSWIGNNEDPNFSGSFMAISGSNVKTFMASGAIIKIFESPEARFVYIGDVLSDTNETETQLKEIHDNVNSALGMVGLSFNNIIRSWYYCKNSLGIDGLYTHRANDLHSANNISDRNISAETIVVSANQHQKQMIASFFAILPKNENFSIEPVRNNMDRTGAVLLNNQNCRMLMIAGLPIAQTKGNSIEILIETAILAVEELIYKYAFEWNQLWRAVAYFQSIADVAIFKKICKEKHIPFAPIVIVQSEFHDKNTRFEFEADFAISNEEQN